MSQENGKPLDHLELASLPADDPARQALEAKLQSGQVEGASKGVWESELALTDRLREALEDVAVPENLQRRLLAVPEAKLRAPVRSRRWLSYAAAILLIVGGLVAIYLERTPAAPMPLSAEIASAISVQAVKHSDAPLEIASANPDTVAAALAPRKLDFPVLMLKPMAGATLVGGGTCDFGSAKAAYTKWQNNGLNYTLFEFNGKNFSAPASFNATIQTPAELWRGDKHYQVVMFAGSAQNGGKCCWALVMEKENAPNIFWQYATSY
ncbi:MAG TPA: hypothetical protein VGN88_07690 [Phycisphaerae bacterium]|jgi:hypothetical protein